MSYYDIFSFVRNNIDIFDVISQYVTLTQNGNYWKGISPFKSEKTPSFTVSPDKKIFYCFSTSCGGDVIDFVSRVEKCSQFEAAKLLIDKYKLKIPDNLISNNKNNNLTETKSFYFKICEFFANWCNKEYYKNNFAKKYIKSRKINDETILTFLIGYCPSSNNLLSFLEEAKIENFLINDLIEAGIIFEIESKKTINSNKKIHLFTFENRIIFPIKNNIGLICGFGGRVFLENDNRVKYINTTSNKEFSKKDILYGLFDAKKNITNEKEIIIVEGYFDCICCYQAGYKNTIATMGTAFTKNHISVLERLVNNICIFYDGDEAGKNAILRLITMCWDSSLEVNLIIIPENNDPASLYEKHELNNIFIKKIHSVDFFINFYIDKYKENTIIKNQELCLKEICICLNNMKNITNRNIIISNISKKLDLSTRFIENYILKLKINKTSIHEETTEKEYKNSLIVSKSNYNDISYEDWCIMSIYSILFFDKKSELSSNIHFLIKKFAPSEFYSLIEEFYKFLDGKSKIEYDYLLFFDKLKDELRQIFFIRIIKYNFELNHFDIIYNSIIKKIWKKCLKESININNKFDSIINLNDFLKVLKEIS